MNAALRTAGCPAAERNILTKPTGGASPVSTPVGADSPVSSGGLRRPARPCLKGRAVPLNRRRKVRDGFLGREGRPSQSPVRKARRQTLYSCLVQPALEVDARFRNESLAPVSRASSATRSEKNWIIQSRSGVCPLDIRDHIPVRRLRNYNHQPVFLPRRLPVGCLQLREEQFNCGRSIAPKGLRTWTGIIF